ncbi:hypothetical protein [Flavobacterium sp. Root420]|uniref:hypothetical protein n=1 Tax=Flavobacterium sp. Root420 TaxID=1736533 RepID=UPI0006F88B4C|nr:hypothetical protein [Flavobacterium sp. Root420]KQX00777.1 hypothetical protein ASC72_07900 [Flavobacterium sp. Root420]
MSKKSNNRKNRILIAFALLLVSLAPIHAQVKETVVTYDIDKREFESELPFDEVFKIKFKSNKVISGIHVRYKIDLPDTIDEKFIKKYYFQFPDKNDPNAYITKEDLNLSVQNFSISAIGPLHPNVPYKFEFFIYEKINVSENAANALKADIKKTINWLYLENEVLPVPDTIVKRFSTVLQKHVKVLYNDSGRIVGPQDLFKSDLRDYAKGLTKANSEITGETDNYTSASRQILPLFLGNPFCYYLKKMDAKDISNASLLDDPMNLLIKGFSDVTLNQMTVFYRRNCNQGFNYSSEIIKGNVKFITNLGLERLDKDNIYQNAESLELLKASIDVMSSLRTKKNNKPYFDSSIDSRITTLLGQMIEYSQNITKNKKIISTLNAEIPDVLANKYSQTKWLTHYDAVPDVESKATPFINLDLGFLYASELNDAFALQTVNFHVKPVNRNAIFSKLKGWDKFLKQACLQIGLAQRLGPSDDSYDTFLTGDLGTPYVGLGFRVNRIVRLSGGVILYQQKNDNPIITDKITKGSFAFTITINSALSSALGYVGGLFAGAN